MTSTDTTATAATSTLATDLAKIEAKLSADWQGAIAFLKAEDANAVAFVAGVTAGVEKGIDDVIAIGQYIGGKLSIINAATTALAAADPNNATLQKVASDIQNGSADLAALSQSLTSGSTAGDNAIVTSTANGIGSLQQLTSLLSGAVGAMATAAANSATATQTVTQGTTTTSSASE